MFCTACAAANPRSATRCGGCGAALAALRRDGGEAGRRDGGKDGGRGGVWRLRGVGWRSVGRAGALNLVLILVLPLAAAAISGGYLWADRSERAAAYDRGLHALAAGDPEAALVAFAAAGGYADAAAQHARTESSLAPVLPLYLAGLDALARGDSGAAVAALIPVAVAFPAYRDTAVLLEQARIAQTGALRGAVDAAIGLNDWLGAERGLVALAATDPGDPDIAAELAALRRGHAPILFGWNGRLLMVGPDGRDQRVIVDEIPAAWPVWSPDRTQIAFVSPEPGGGGLSLYVVGADGGGMRRLGASLRPYEPPVWSPDGSRIAFLSTAGAPEPEAEITMIDPNFAAYFGSSLYFDTDSPPDATPATLPAAALGPGGSPSFDPTPAGGSAAPAPAPGPAAEGVTAVSAQTTQTSATGATGAIGSTVDPPPPPRAGGPALLVVEVATGVISDPVGGRVAATNSPTWAPGGDRIAFVSRPGEEMDQRLTGLPEAEIYVVDLRGGALAPPAPGLVRNPWRVAWSPAAGAEVMIVWSRGPGDAYEDGLSPLTLVDARGGRVADLNPHLARVTMPVWSPDGGRVAYIEDDFILRVRAVPGIPDLAGAATAAEPRTSTGSVLGAAEPGGPRPAAEPDQHVPLTNAPTEFLTWSPDGNAILLAGGGRPSQIVHLTGETGAGVPEPFLLVYDTNRRQGSPPRWSPVAPAPEPRPASVGGTAWDG